MNYKQKIVFDLNDAILTIFADFDSLVNDDEEGVIKTFNSSQITNNDIISTDYVNIDLHNISNSEILDDRSPIQFMHSNELINLFLLEETNYKLIFEITSSKISMEDINLFTELSVHNPEIFNINRINDSIVTIDLNFKSHVGEQFFDISFNDSKYYFPVEVRSRKINYETDYPEMISDLAKYASSILFDKDSSLFHGYEHFDRKETKYEDYMLLEYIFKSENLPSVQEYMSKNLYSSLNLLSEEVPLDFAYNVNSDVLCNLASNPQSIVESNQEMYLFKKNNEYYIPSFIDEIKFEENIDTPENRFYKYFLEYVKSLILDLIDDNDISGFIKERLYKFENMVTSYLSRDFFSEISKLNYIPFNSQVLQKKEGYRDIFSYFLVLEFGYKINCELITKEIRGFEKRVSQIYEYWCYFKLYELINDLTGSNKSFNNFIDDDWTLNIKSGFINDFEYIDESGIPVRISLAYKQEFLKNEEEIYRSYSLNMEPDFTVLIKYDNNNYFIHFDAKYRVENGEPKSEDIQKMHTYKDSIENSIASFVLFPGYGGYKKLFNEFNNSIMSVGAFSLNPGNDRQEIENIKEYLTLIIGDIVD